MTKPVYDPTTYKILPLLQNEEQGQLEKIANFFDIFNKKTREVKTFPETLVGGAALERLFFYNANNDLAGSTVNVIEWTQEMEDLAVSGIITPPPFNNTKSVLFDGVDEYVNFGDVNNFDIANAFSVSLWVKPDNIAASRILFSKAGAAPAVKGYMLRHNATTGALFLQMRSSTNRSFTFDKSLVASSWQHVVFTYAGGSNINGAHVYLDAVKSNTPASGSLSGTMLEGQDFILGSRSGSFYFSGNIDEVTVWNKELSQAEVTELYNSGAPADPTLHSASANLTQYNPMGDGDTHPTLQDDVGSNDGTMTNMAPSNIVSDTP